MQTYNQLRNRPAAQAGNLANVRSVFQRAMEDGFLTGSVLLYLSPRHTVEWGRLSDIDVVVYPAHWPDVADEIARAGLVAQLRTIGSPELYPTGGRCFVLQNNNPSFYAGRPINFIVPASDESVLHWRRASEIMHAVAQQHAGLGDVLRAHRTARVALFNAVFDAAAFD